MNRVALVAALLASCGERTTTLAGDDANVDAPPLAAIGCADGEREGFVDVARAPHVAGCGGAFLVPGVTLAVSPGPTCGRVGGDDGPHLDGAGCAAEDLCAAGWHVCLTQSDVMDHFDGALTCADAAPPLSGPVFFATRQSGMGGSLCDPTGTDDVFGCGTMGQPITSANCAPLDVSCSDHCRELDEPWRCNRTASGGVDEAAAVFKIGPGGGGVLCCSD